MVLVFLVLSIDLQLFHQRSEIFLILLSYIHFKVQIFWEGHNIWLYVVIVKFDVGILQNFVSFAQNLSFKSLSHLVLIFKSLTQKVKKEGNYVLSRRFGNIFDDVCFKLIYFLK